MLTIIFDNTIRYSVFMVFILYGSDSTDFVQIPPACGLNTYQIMYGETLDFQCILVSAMVT